MTERFAGRGEEVSRQVFDLAENIGLRLARFRWASFHDGTSIQCRAEVHLTDGLQPKEVVHSYACGTLGDQVVELASMRSEFLRWMDGETLFGVSLPRSAAAWSSYSNRRGYSTDAWPYLHVSAPLDSEDSSAGMEVPLVGKDAPCWPSRRVACTGSAET